MKTPHSENLPDYVDSEQEEESLQSSSVKPKMIPVREVGGKTSASASVRAASLSSHLPPLAATNQPSVKPKPTLTSSWAAMNSPVPSNTTSFDLAKTLGELQLPPRARPSVAPTDFNSSMQLPAGPMDTIMAQSEESIRMPSDTGRAMHPKIRTFEQILRANNITGSQRIVELLRHTDPDVKARVH